MNPNKAIAMVLLSIIAVWGLLVIQSADAAVSKPSVPQFTVSNDNNGDIIIKIKNQVIPDTNTTHLYYQVRTKDHNYNDWTLIEVYTVEDSGYWHREPYQRANSGQYTTLTINTETKQEFQVQALIGYITKYNDHSLDLYDALTTFKFYGESSSWSAAQSIDGKVATATSTPMPTSVPTEPPQTPTATTATPNVQIDLFRDVDWQNVAFAVMALAITILGVAVIMLWRRIPKNVP